MIDIDIINNLEGPIRHEVGLAFKTIDASGIIESQLNRLLARLAEGAQDETEEKIVSRIRDYRRLRSQLLSLKQLGESFEG